MEFESHKDEGKIVPVITLTAAEDWPTSKDGLVHLDFSARKGDVIVRYARIENVPHGMEGRAVLMWILAHPHRPIDATRMAFTYMLLRYRLRDRF